MGDKVGFMLMPGKDPRRAGVARRRGPAVDDHLNAKNPDVAAAYIDFLTDANAAKVLVDTDNLPAMKDAPAPAGGVSADVANAWQKLNEADGVIPYLDYTTPTFYDDISGAIQELLAGKQDAGRVHQGRAGRSTTSGRSPADGVGRAAGAGTTARPASRASSATCTCCRRSSSSPAFVLYPLYHAAYLSLYDWDGLTVGTWAGLDNYARRLHGRGAAQRVRARADPAALLRGAAGADRAAAGGRDGAGAGARAGALPDDPVPAAGDRDGRRRA